MCKFWKKFCKTEGKNHHFPELASKNDLMNRLFDFTCKKSGISIVLFMSLMIGIAYLTQTNITATYGFKIRDLERGLAEMENENKRLSLEYSKLQSIEKINQAVAYFKLVPMNNPESLIVFKDNLIALNKN